MERLTDKIRNFDGTASSPKSLVIEEGMQKGMPSAYCSSIVTKLADYEDAEEQGLLLRLPCKVGDNVYKIWSCGKNGKSVAEFRISHIDIDDLQNIEFAFISTKNISTSYWFCKIDDFGKTVFLTKAEAEQALAKMKGEEV